MRTRSAKRVLKTTFLEKSYRFFIFFLTNAKLCGILNCAIEGLDCEIKLRIFPIPGLKKFWAGSSGG